MGIFAQELRGSTRRTFLSGAVAIGAALGWGPTRLLDFLQRAGGLAHGDPCFPTQRLVILCGQRGAHGYPQLLFPHPDSFADSVKNTRSPSGDRYTPTFAGHFLQGADEGGDATPFSPQISHTTHYERPAAKPDTGVGAWAAGERFKYLHGVDNQAFRGFVSTHGTSRAIDRKVFRLSGRQPIPGNIGADKAQNFIVLARETPWVAEYGLSKAITAIDGGGITPFHIQGAHNHWINKDRGWTVMAAAATLQLAIPAVVPVVILGNLKDEKGGDARAFYGSLPGAPTPATAASASGMVDLLSRSTTRAAGLLNHPENAGLFAACQRGFHGSGKSAPSPFSRGDAPFRDLSGTLTPTQADRLRYGVTGDLPRAGELRDRLIVTAKALKLGLTAQVVLGYFDDDPHALFTRRGVGGINAATAAAIFGNLLNAFMGDLMDVPDPFYPQVRLGDNTVIAFIGDTPRTALNISNWNDPTAGGQNRTWIMSNGLLNTGFFGGDRFVPGDPVVTNAHDAPGPGEGGLWDLRTGDLIPFTPGFTTSATGADMRQKWGETAMAAVLFAVTRGDLGRVNGFYSGAPFPAVQKVRRS